jgi:hypothetical protein
MLRMDVLDALAATGVGRGLESQPPTSMADPKGMTPTQKAIRA